MAAAIPLRLCAPRKTTSTGSRSLGSLSSAMIPSMIPWMYSALSERKTSLYASMSFDTRSAPLASRVLDLRRDVSSGHHVLSGAPPTAAPGIPHTTMSPRPGRPSCRRRHGSRARPSAPSAPIPVSTTPTTSLAEARGDAVEQGVCGGPHSVQRRRVRRARSVVEPAGAAGDPHVRAVGSEIRRARLDALRRRPRPPGSPSLADEALVQETCEAGREMLDDEIRRRKVARLSPANTFSSAGGPPVDAAIDHHLIAPLDRLRDVSAVRARAAVVAAVPSSSSGCRAGDSSGSMRYAVLIFLSRKSASSASDEAKPPCRLSDEVDRARSRALVRGIRVVERARA